MATITCSGQAEARNPELPLSLSSGCRNPRIWAVLHDFPRHIVRDLDWNQSNQISNRHPYGMPKIQIVAYSQYETRAPKDF